MPVLPAAVSVAGALVLAALIGWIVQRERRLARLRVELLTSLGFRKVEQPDPGHAAALLALYRRGRNRDRRLDLLRVFRRDGAAGHLYVFDVYAWAGKRSGLAAAGAVGLVRAGAGFPSCELYSVAELGGPGLGAFGGSFAGTLAHGLGHGPEVRLDDAPGPPLFTVISTAEGGEEAVRRALGPEIRAKLGEARFAVLAAAGDALALQGNPSSPANRGDWAGLLRRLVEHAPRVADALSPRA